MVWNVYQRYDIGLFLLHKDWLLDLKYYLFKDPRNIIWLFTLRDIVQLLWCYKYLFCTFWKALLSCRKNRNKIVLIINSLTIIIVCWRKCNHIWEGSCWIFVGTTTADNFFWENYNFGSYMFRCWSWRSRI